MLRPSRQSEARRLWDGPQLQNFWLSENGTTTANVTERFPSRSNTAVTESLLCVLPERVLRWARWWCARLDSAAASASHQPTRRP